MKDFSANFTTRDSQVYTELDNFREAFKKKKTKKILKNVKIQGGGFGAGPCQKKKP